MNLINRIKELFSGQKKELEEQLIKNAKQTELIESFKEKFREFNVCYVERNLYSSLISAFAKARTFDDLFKAALEIFSENLKARYYGIFWLDSSEEYFEYKYGKGYKSINLQKVPKAGSLLERCLKEKKVFFIKDMKIDNITVMPGQDPLEYNGLFAPIFLLGKVTGVMTLSNMDPEAIGTAESAVRNTTPLLSAGLERLLFQEQNERNIKALAVTHSIASTLEKSVDDSSIFDIVCSQVPKLFPCAACLFIEAENDKPPVVKAVYPNKFLLGGNPDSQNIILKNFLAEFVNGQALIPNLHFDRRWAWPDTTVKSICMVPISSRMPYRIMAVGPSSEVYKETSVSFLELVAMQAAVTLERAAHFRMQETLARMDGLTGLLNHRVFQETLKDEVERGRRYKRPLSLIMIDIDDFKKFNDTYGHPVGDQVIKMVSGHLKHDPRITDRTFRYGGEEFSVILPETPGDKAMILAERIRKRICEDKTVCPAHNNKPWGLCLHTG